jgi:hypothetical protein
MSDEARKEGVDRPHWLRTNQGVSVILTLVFAGYLAHLLSADWVYERMRDGFALGFFPLVGLAFMMACTLIMAVDGHRRQVDEDMGGTGLKEVALCFCLVVGSYAFIELTIRLGFLVACPVFLFVLIYLFGARPLRSAVIAAIVITVVLYGVLTVLGVRLPVGVLPF